MNPRSERRLNRSNNPNLALKMWLASLSQRLRVPGFIVTDQTGLVVATNMKGPKADEVAAMAPMLSKRDEAGVRPVDRHRVPLTIHELDHRGATLLICAVGDRIRRETGARIAAHGIRRILKERRLQV